MCFCSAKWLRIAVCEISKALWVDLSLRKPHWNAISFSPDVISCATREKEEVILPFVQGDLQVPLLRTRGQVSVRVFMSISSPAGSDLGKSEFRHFSLGIVVRSLPSEDTEIPFIYIRWLHEDVRCCNLSFRATGCFCYIIGFLKWIFLISHSWSRGTQGSAPWDDFLVLLYVLVRLILEEIEKKYWDFLPHKVL